MSSSTGGFERLTAYNEARALLDECCFSHGRVEERPLAGACGRVVARSLQAPRPVPHEDRAAVDGVAVRARDTFDASGRSPVRLTVSSGEVGENRAVPVQAGSPVPDGADAVLRVEDTERRAGEFVLYDSVSVGGNIATVGSDVGAGDQLVGAGDRLTPADVALARATGLERVTVSGRPRVGVLATGHRVVESGPGAGEGVETDGSMVASLAGRWGGDPTHRGVVPADRDALVAAIEASLDDDILVTTGNTGVGERDILPAVVADRGTLRFHGVALEPGNSVGFGVVDGTPVVMLPGGPAACYLDAVQFLRPAVAAVAGTTPRSFPTVRAALDGKLPSEPGTRTFARVRLAREEDPSADIDRRAVPLRVAGGNALSSVTAADGWVVVPEQLEGYPAGETVGVQQWERLRG